MYHTLPGSCTCVSIHRSDFEPTTPNISRASLARCAVTASPWERKIFNQAQIEAGNGLERARGSRSPATMAATGAAVTMGAATIKALLIDLDDCLYDIEVMPLLGREDQASEPQFRQDFCLSPVLWMDASGRHPTEMIERISVMPGASLLEKRRLYRVLTTPAATVSGQVFLSDPRDFARDSLGALGDCILRCCGGSGPASCGPRSVSVSCLTLAAVWRLSGASSPFRAARCGATGWLTC